ncbi:hypothetical protein V493_07796, partial [Pseudogymnoascus sp. VKM F-4281 (FW-2241)]
GVSVGAGRGSRRGEVAVPAFEIAPAPVAVPAFEVVPACPAPQTAEGRVEYSSNTAFSGRVRTGHGEYSMSAATESALRIPQEASVPQQSPTHSEPAKLSLSKRYSCHICRCINKEIERCASCGHRLCIDCEWLMPIARTDGAAQEFKIYEDSSGGMEFRDMQVDDQRRSESVYPPSEFEQENYMDRRSDTPDLHPSIWARKAALAKAHYTTPRSPTVGSLPPSPSHFTTPQSPVIRSPPPSPVDLSHLSASDYPEPLRLASSPVRPPGPRDRRVVRDNPFVVADLLSAPPRQRRVLRVDSEEGIRSRDGQVSPLPGRDLARTVGSGATREGPVVAQSPVWQTNRIPIPEFGVQRHSAHRHSALQTVGEGKMATEGLAEPRKLDPILSESSASSSSRSKSSGDGEEKGGSSHTDDHGRSACGEALYTQRDGPPATVAASGVHGGCEHSQTSQNAQMLKNLRGSCPLRAASGVHGGCEIPPPPHPQMLQNSGRGCPLRAAERHCGCHIPAKRVCHAQAQSCQVRWAAGSWVAC